MNSHYIKLADKSNGLWSIEDRGPTANNGKTLIRTYTSKKVIIKCPSYTFTQSPSCHYLVADGKISSFTPDVTVIE